MSCLSTSFSPMFFGRLMFSKSKPNIPSFRMPYCVRDCFNLIISFWMKSDSLPLILSSNALYTSSGVPLAANTSECNVSPRIPLKKRISSDFLPFATERFSLTSSSSALKYSLKIALMSPIPLPTEAVDIALPILIIHSIDASPGTRFR